jgi:hypothetical protein
LDINGDCNVSGNFRVNGTILSSGGGSGTVDSTVVQNSNNAVSGGAVYTALQNKKSWIGTTILNKVGLSSYTITIDDIVNYKWIYFGLNTNGGTVNVTLPTQTQLIGYNGIEIRFLNGQNSFANVMNIIPPSNTFINRLTTTFNLTSRQGTSFHAVYDEVNANWMVFSRGHV